MAMDLKAVFRVVDKATSTINKINNRFKQMDRIANQTQGSFSRLDRVTNRTFANIGKGASSAASSVRNLALAAGGAVLAYQTLGKLIDKTIVSAAQFEMKDMTIRAMFQGDNKGAQKYIDMITKRAIDSPLFGQNDYFENSKTFLTMSKDMNQLNKILDITERFAASDMKQGFDGAAFALRELFSQDAVSMVERFEMPRKIANEIKKLPIEKQLVALDKYLTKIGFGTKFLDDISETALANWNQLTERINVALKDIGMGALRELKPVLVDLNRGLSGPAFQNFKNSLAKGVAGGFRDIISAGRSAWSYIEKTYINNPAFQKLSVQGKIDFVIGDVLKMFDNWLNAGGRDQLAQIATKGIDILAKALETGAPRIAQAGLVLGSELGSALMRGMKDYLEQSTLGSFALKVLEANPAAKVAMKLAEWRGQSNKPASSPSLGSQSFGKFIDGSHANGLSYVPRNNYIANLHKGERVLTAQENREYSQGGPTTITFGDIHLHGVGGDMKQAARELMGIMAKEIKSAGALIAR